MSSMRDTMGTQPEALARILNDRGPVERAADRLVGHRILHSRPIRHKELPQVVDTRGGRCDAFTSG
jgi:hypothetical protein